MKKRIFQKKKLYVKTDLWDMQDGRSPMNGGIT